MYNRLIQFINKHNILDEAQYGTNHAILDIINTIQQNMDSKLFSCAHLSTSTRHLVDTVDHQI